MVPLAEFDADDCGDRLRRGAVLVYPTEAVWGLGCDPLHVSAVQRLLDIKQRPAGKGLILVAARLEQLAGWIDLDRLDRARREEIRASWPGPVTWALPCPATVSRLVRGDHETLAVRVSAHPVTAALCRALDGPLVSTSANLAGQPPAFTRDALDPALLARVDGRVRGETGGLAAPSRIRDALSGRDLRP